MNLQQQKQDTINKCPYCGKPYKRIEESVLGHTHRYLVTQCDCEEKARNKELAKKEGLKLIKKIRRLKDCGVGKRFKDKTFKNYDRSNSPKAYQACLDYARNYFGYEKKGTGLFLTGKVGTGKTHLAVAIVDYIARIHKRGFWGQIIFTTSVNLLSSIRLGYETGKAQSICEYCEACQLLIIDDLGSEKMTDWVGEVFYRIIDNRYANLKPTIITSNYTLAELKKKTGERLASRIYEMCKGVKFEGKDWRLK